MQLPDNIEPRGSSLQDVGSAVNDNVDPKEPETDDIDPPLDEEDLEENNLSVEEADQIVWEPAPSGSSGPEEKDITD